MNRATKLLIKLFGALKPRPHQKLVKPNHRIVEEMLFTPPVDGVSYSHLEIESLKLEDEIWDELSAGYAENMGKAIDAQIIFMS